MITPRTLDERIGRLAPEMDPRLRVELQGILRTLRADYPVGVVLAMSRAALCLFRLIYAAAQRPWPSDNLFNVISRAARPDPKENPNGLGILPEALDSPLHALRMMSNKADHFDEKFLIDTSMAESVLNAFLSVMGWFYCQSQLVPALECLYAPERREEDEVGFTLGIDRDLETYTDSEQHLLLTAIGALLRMKRPVTVVQRVRGSVLLTILVSRSEAEELRHAVEVGALAEFKVMTGWSVPVPAKELVGATLEARSSRGMAEEDFDSYPEVVIPPEARSGVERLIAGRYEILALVGVGGMARVSRAVDRLTNRRVAVKEPRSGDPQLKELIHSEAKVLGGLDHPNIVRLFDLGFTQEGPYLVLDYLEGGNLADRLRRRPIDCFEAALLVKSIAHAVAHTHKNGIIHRNIKPANICFTSDGTPKLIDWDLALSPNSPESSPGAIVGTPRYMAPEQARGEEVGPCADVWALGVVLFECLTGQVPFTGESTLDTLRQISSSDLPPWEIFAPAVPRDLVAICQKCLRKNPLERYPTAAELADELGRFLDRLPVKARPASTLKRIGKSLLRVGWQAPLWGAAAGLVLLLYRERGLETASRHEAERAALAAIDRTNFLIAERNLERGLDWCRRGDIDGGTRILAQGAELAPQDAVELRAELRAQANAWSKPVKPHDLRLAVWGGAGTAVLAADGRSVVVAGGTSVALLSTSHDTSLADPEFLISMPPVIAVNSNGAFAYRLGDRIVIREGGHRQTLDARDARITTLVFSPDGRQLAGGSADGGIILWDVAQRRVRAVWKYPKVRCLAWHPSGEELAIGTEGGRIDFWNTRTLFRARMDLEPREAAGAGAVTCLTFSPDGKEILVGNRSGIVRLWGDFTERTLISPSRGAGGNGRGEEYHGAFTGRPLGPPFPHRSAIRSLAFDPSGRSFVAGTEDRKVRLWSVSSSNPVGPPVELPGPVSAVGFAPGGDVLACATDDVDGAVRVLGSLLAISPNAPVPCLPGTRSTRSAMVLRRWPNPLTAGRK
jgi:hypothetical protein